MANAVGGTAAWPGTAFVACFGGGVDWLSTAQAKKDVDQYVTPGSVIILNYGVNDLSRHNDYITTINRYAQDWISKGATVYFASVGPVGENEYASNANEEHEEIADWLADGVPALGKVQMIQLNFGSYKEYNMKNRFFNMDLAGGALLDIGVYALSIARSFMESKPDQVLSQVKFAPTGADEQAGILLMNKEAQMATLALSLHSKQPKRAVISCENGYIEIMEYPRADQAVIVEAGML